jgi:hypothetical protein
MKQLALAIPLGLLGALLCCASNEIPKDHLDRRDSAQKESQLIKPEVVQGCYEFGTLRWRPDLRLGEDLEFITPPSRIHILADHGNGGFEQQGYLVRPAPGVPRSIHRASYWTPKGPSAIEVVWTTGFSGLEMSLNLEGGTLRGKATSFWDFPRRKQSADVVAQKVDCVENTRRSVEGTYRNPALGYSIEVPPDLNAKAGDEAGPVRGITISLPSGGKIVVFGEPNSLEWKTPVEGVQAKLAREKCPSGHQKVSPARVGSLTGANGSLVCGDRVVKLFLAFRTGGGPIYCLRLDTHTASTSNDEKILQNVTASLNIIPWE